MHEMMIGGQYLGESVIVHDDKRNAVCERPFFVGSVGIKVDTAIKKFAAHFRDDDVRIASKLAEQIRKEFPPRSLGESIRNFGHHPGRGNVQSWQYADRKYFNGKRIADVR